MFASHNGLWWYRRSSTPPLQNSGYSAGRKYPIRWSEILVVGLHDPLELLNRRMLPSLQREYPLEIHRRNTDTRSNENSLQHKPGLVTMPHPIFERPLPLNMHDKLTAWATNWPLTKGTLFEVKQVLKICRQPGHWYLNRSSLPVQCVLPWRHR